MLRSILPIILIGMSVVARSDARAEALVQCPSPAAQAEIANAAGRDFNSLRTAIALVEKRYGPPHSLRHDESAAHLVYKSAKGAVAIDLSRDEDGAIDSDCVAY